MAERHLEAWAARKWTLVGLGGRVLMETETQRSLEPAPAP